MTNQALRPDRRRVGQARWWRAVPIPVFAVLEVCLVSLTGIAINVATIKPKQRTMLLGPLRLIRHYPWPAVVILTAVASWLVKRGRLRAGQPFVYAPGNREHTSTVDRAGRSVWSLATY